MKRLAVLLVIGITLVLVGEAGGKQLDANKKVHPVPVSRLSEKIVIDGDVSEKAWQQVEPMELKYEVWPGENITPPVKSVVLITYDNDALYAAFRCYDPDPKAIRAHFTDRDGAWADDWIGLILDTFNDERRDYLLLINPFGVQMDNIESPDGGAEWDAIWESAARITEFGWSAEIRVPFSSLSFQRMKDGQIWGLDVVRSYPRVQRHHIGLFPRDRSNNCYMCQAVKIQGFEGVNPGRSLEIVPTLTSAKTDTRDTLPNGPMTNGGAKGQGGVSVRWGITPNINLNGTIKPDFSQVEADAMQLDINEPFALYYSEKRPFFMEAADFFNNTLGAVYTRTIREPSWGVKLSGKEGGNTIGSYIVRDDMTNLIIPGNQESSATTLTSPSTASVVRYKRDLGKSYTIGALVTDREGEGYFNRVGGIDGELRFTEKDRLSFQFLTSRTRYPEQVSAEFSQSRKTLSDNALDITYDHSTRTLSWYMSYQNIGEDFRADLGFMPRVNYRRALGGINYIWNGTPKDWYSTLMIDGRVLDDKDQQGNLLRRNYRGRFVFEGKLQSHAYIELNRTREAYASTQFDLNEVFLHTCMTPSSALQFVVNLRFGDRIDYANTRLGQRAQALVASELRFGQHIRVSPAYTYERMRVDQGWLYTADIRELNVAYHFNSRAFLRAILQKVNYSYSKTLYSDNRDPIDQSLASQYLFSYKLDPRTVLFIGYSDNYRGNQAYDLTQGSRSFFAKVGYAWNP